MSLPATHDVSDAATVTIDHCVCDSRKRTAPSRNGEPPAGSPSPAQPLNLSVGGVSRSESGRSHQCLGLGAHDLLHQDICGPISHSMTSPLIVITQSSILIIATL